jgi:hypothetical protein
MLELIQKEKELIDRRERDICYWEDRIQHLKLAY